MNRVDVPSARTGSIWNTPPVAQSFAWIFIDSPAPARVMTRSEPFRVTETSPVSDSPQVANRVAVDCTNSIPNPFHPGTVNHCGGVSQWDVASGGRMGQVMGEDAVEVAPPATACTHQCQAQDQVRGQSVVLGFPFPVPDASRLKPRFP